MSPKYSAQTEAGRPQPNYSNTHSTSLPAKNNNSPQVSPYQVKIPLAFLLLQVLLPVDVCLSRGGGVPAINIVNRFKLGFQVGI